MIKKYLTIVAVTALATSACFAQGTVGFFNSSTTKFQIQPNPPNPPVDVPQGGGFVEFLWSANVSQPAPPSASAINPAGWTTLGGPKPIAAPGTGRFNGGTLTASPLSPGAIIAGVVRGWTGAFPDYASALAGPAFAIGYSAVFTVDTGDPTTTPPGAVGLIYSGTATPFAGLLIALPEPSTYVLAGLGAALLLFFRRHRR